MSTAPSERSRVTRVKKRARYDRATIEAILDEALVCNLAFVHDGKPCGIPTLHWRIDDRVYVHGARASRALDAATDGLDVCLTVTLLDGLVLARSAFHHSVNFRSVVLYGQAQPVEGAAKAAALASFVEGLYPGRGARTRPPNEKELAATKVLSIPIDEASAKVRDGGPVDDEADLSLACWAGVIPLGLTLGTPVADAGVSDRVAAPGAESIGRLGCAQTAG